MLLRVKRITIAVGLSLCMDLTGNSSAVWQIYSALSGIGCESLDLRGYKRLKVRIALHPNSASELGLRDVTCHMRMITRVTSQSHPTQVNTFSLNLS